MSASVKGSTISLTRGDSLRVNLRLMKDGEEYIPVTGDVIRFALKKKVTDAEPLIVKEIPIDTMVLAIEPEDTKPLAFGIYRYDMEITTANGYVDTFIGPADFNVKEEVH